MSPHGTEDRSLQREKKNYRSFAFDGQMDGQMDGSGSDGWMMDRWTNKQTETFDRSVGAFGKLYDSYIEN